jgi:hypothetical protein
VSNPDVVDDVLMEDRLTIVASSPGSLGLGSQRVLLVAAGQDGSLGGGPDEPATVSFRSESGPAAEVETDWVWGIEGVRGFYVAQFDFPSAGVWEATLSVGGASAQPASFQVSEEPVVPEVGSDAPRSDTPTAEDAPLEDISTDPTPDPAFYELSVADAVSNGRPTVIVFATPAFCQTAICGPALDLVETIAADHPGADFVHVEVYEDLDLTDGELVAVPAIGEWGLQTEPWVFVVDSNGVVAARFEGTVGSDELAAALENVGA